MRAPAPIRYAALLMLGADLAQAKELPGEDLFNLSLEQLFQVRVTSSTLTDQSLRTVPSSITVFTRKQIQQLGIRTLSELMNHVPGYQSYRTDAIFSTYASRSRRSEPGSREVLLMMDGQRLNHDIFGHAGDAESEIQLDNVERVEFIRGPGSAIYGANAFLGVVSITTATELNDAGASYGSHQQQRAALNASHAFANGLQTSIHVQDLSDEGERQTLYDSPTVSFTDTHQQFDGRSVYWRAHWRNAEGDDWALQARHVEQQVADGYHIGGLGDAYNQSNGRTSFLALNYAHVFNAQWQLNSRVYDSPYNFNPRWRNTGAPMILISRIEGRESGIENRLAWQQDTAQALLGLDYARNVVERIETSAWFPPAPPGTPANGIAIDDRKVGALYAQWQDALGQDFTYILGARKDDYTEGGGYTSPRLGLIWQANDANTLKLLYGEAFRAPTMNELGGTANLVQLGNPQLKPEISKTAELIWLHTGSQHSSSISLFDTEIVDIIVLDGNFPGHWINGGQQHMSGVEAEWQWFFADEWQLRTGLSHIFDSPASSNNGKNVKANPNAEQLFGVSLIYHQGDVTASLSGRYHGDSRDAYKIGVNPERYNTWGGYTLFDAHAHYQVTPAWQLFANVRNFGDRDYTQPAVQRAANIAGVPGLGREMEVGVRWTF